MKETTRSQLLVRESVGTLRPWAWDCVPNTYAAPYAADSPMRAVECVGAVPVAQHLLLSSAAPLPVVDQEYVELTETLLAVASADPGSTFVVAEVGARYAPWAVRAAVAARRLGRATRAILLEPMAQHVEWIHEHFLLNGFARSDYEVITAPFGRGGIGLAELLASVDHVDFLDIDAQGAEAGLVNTTADAAALENKVYRVEIEPHPTRYDRDHRIVTTTAAGTIATLVRHGFTIERNVSTLFSLYKTALGRVYWRGGSIHAVNRRFRTC